MSWQPGLPPKWGLGPGRTASGGGGDGPAVWVSADHRPSNFDGYRRIINFSDIFCFLPPMLPLVQSVEPWEFCGTAMIGPCLSFPEVASGERHGSEIEETTASCCGRGIKADRQAAAACRAWDAKGRHAAHEVGVMVEWW